MTRPTRSRRTLFLSPQSLLVGLVLVSSASIGLAGGPPSLAGQVVKSQAAGGDPLAQAQVELLVPGTNTVRHKVYTNPEGKFAFYQVAPGPYEVRVKFGKQVLRQMTAARSVERQKFSLGAKPTKLPRIVVQSQ